MGMRQHGKTRVDERMILKWCHHKIGFEVMDWTDMVQDRGYWHVL
jgi:hypothetical protein